MNDLKIALIQMQVKGGNKEWNVNHAIELISEATSQNANIILLPECMDLGWTDPSSLKLAEEIPNGSICQALMQTAKKHSVYICSGLTEKSDDGIFNSAVIINKSGELISKHRKINELDIAHPYYAKGTTLSVVKTEYGTLGLMICADGFAKDFLISKTLCYMGADIILSPSAWAVEHDHDNTKEPYGDLWRNSYIPVAKEFSTAFFSVSNVGTITGGPWKGMKCIGCSLAINSLGEEVLQGPYGINSECILYVNSTY